MLTTNYERPLRSIKQVLNNTVPTVNPGRLLHLNTYLLYARFQEGIWYKILSFKNQRTFSLQK